GPKGPALRVSPFPAPRKAPALRLRRYWRIEKHLPYDVGLGRPRLLVAAGVRLVHRVAQIRLQRVIADAEDAARFALVAARFIEDQPRVAAAPRPHRLVLPERGTEDRHMIAADQRRQVVEIDDVGGRDG